LNKSNKETQKEMENLKQKKYLVNSYLSIEANDVIKQFVGTIKHEIKNARKIVQGVECKTTQQFGKEILKRDGLQIGTATFYAGFNDRLKCSSQLMTMEQIEENLKTKTLTFIKISYTGRGCWGK